MFKKSILAAVAACALPLAAQAQDVEAPDGSEGFGFEPYIAIGGGYHDFDRNDEDIERFRGGAEGAFINGTVGANVPLGPVFVGAEGFGSYGFSDIDWEYGAAGRFGVRVGDSGMFFGRVGYMWIEGENDPGDDFIDTDPDDGSESAYDADGMLYGIGVEVGPQDIGLGGITGNSGVRLRLGVDTFDDFESLRPNAAVVMHF